MNENGTKTFSNNNQDLDFEYVSRLEIIKRLTTNLSQRKIISHCDIYS